MTDNYSAKLAENAERQLKINISLQPVKDQAVKLIMEAATPNGLTVTDEGGEYFVNPEGLVSWENYNTKKKLTESIQNMPAVNVLSWARDAAEFLACREPAFNVSSDPTGLGL